MTLDRAREILGSKYENVSDEKINVWLVYLENIAKIAINQATINNILPRKIYEGSNLSSYLRRKADI
ncbi:MAG: hypothetical protein US68_C0022G0002 [Candidatus Shapirobacteria bacterium GW2011_GWE1_38_10]|uniref:Uncharacterized protein n=1 Tax=Candidatus Shapirobacteria bacterium GW2011_GWE1_38_10 TaxID=1618488 RepID=A0A0G0I2S3_9BACT|nr:MAG: hypothetical protein US68_C0022G0002 [Candidatus Shapirobacteria bacterium GW2011_GWE1_38_10]